MSLSGSKPIQRAGFAPLVPEIHHARYGDLDERPGPAQDRPARPTSWRRSSSSRSRARAATSSRRPTSCRASGRLCDEARDPARPRRGPGRDRPDRADVRLGALGGRRRHRLPGQGDRQRPAAGGDRRQGRRDGLAAAAATPRPSAATPSPAPSALATLGLVEGRYMANADRRGEQLTAAPPRPGRAGTRSIKEVRGLGLMVGMEVRSPAAGPTPPSATGSSSGPSAAGSCSCPAGRAPSGSARRSA